MSFKFCPIYFLLCPDGFIAGNTQIGDVCLLKKTLKLLPNLSLLYENWFCLYIYISSLLFHYTQIKMTHLSWPPPNMSTVRQVCNGLRTGWLSSFVGSFRATGWLRWTLPQEGRDNKQSFFLLQKNPIHGPVAFASVFFFNQKFKHNVSCTILSNFSEHCPNVSYSLYLCIITF